jgi:putative membrane protein insertion efficiency factor
MTATCDAQYDHRSGLDSSALTGGDATDTDVVLGGHRPVGTRVAVGLIQMYQLARTGRTSPCRFVPTCSQYAVVAVERHGLRRGLRLTLGRLGRCRPGGPFGSDPVPE